MENNKNDKLWTSSFTILWQSQLVSTVGDAVYGIALGFWVLSVTGSTALMGALMCASSLPGVLVAPFAGVIIDNSNRKRLFILMDMIRGVCIVLLAIAAYRGFIAVWMVFAAGILLSVCGAIFNPGINATIPDIVAKSKISNATSVFSVLGAASNMIGSCAGGFLYQILGAPALFLFDGLSFLFSGTSISFVKIPVNTRKEKVHFFQDMSQGFQYMWKQKGLKMALIMASITNFFTYIGIVLILPFCKYTKSLGAGKYGIITTCAMGGAMIGFIILSIVTVKSQNKFKLYIASNIIYNICMITAFNQSSFIIMAVLLVFGWIFNSVYNVLLISTIQASTSKEVRGKVMSVLNMMTQGLTPFAEALGGILGGILPIRIAISSAFIATFLLSIPFYFSRAFKEYIKGENNTYASEGSIQA